jgi:hypothetical protein
MAAHMTVSSKHPSWKERCLSNEKGTKGFLKETMEFNDSLDSDDPFAFANDSLAFLKLVNLFKGGRFLLLPGRENRVNLVHSCFMASNETGRGNDSAFGILGSRCSSPFKRVNIEQAVACQHSLRVTRSEERKELLAPPFKDFAKCKSVDKFRDSAADPGGKGCLSDALGKLPSACFVHRSIFKIFGTEGSMRAGDLAMRALKKFSKETKVESKNKEEDGDKETKRRIQLLLFLWSIENSRMSEVKLHDPPDNDVFDLFTQKIRKKLEKNSTPTKGESKEKEKLNSNGPPHPNGIDSQGRPGAGLQPTQLVSRQPHRQEKILKTCPRLPRQVTPRKISKRKERTRKQKQKERKERQA